MSGVAGGGERPDELSHASSRSSDGVDSGGSTLSVLGGEQAAVEAGGVAGPGAKRTSSSSAAEVESELQEDIFARVPSISGLGRLEQLASGSSRAGQEESAGNVEALMSASVASLRGEGVADSPASLTQRKMAELERRADGSSRNPSISGALESPFIRAPPTRPQSLEANLNRHSGAGGSSSGATGGPPVINYANWRRNSSTGHSGHHRASMDGSTRPQNSGELTSVMSRQVRMAQVVQRRANLESQSKNDGHRKMSQLSGKSEATAAGEVGENEQIWDVFGQDHIRLLYLIYCYTMITPDDTVEANGEPRLSPVAPIPPPKAGDDFLQDNDAASDMWIRKMPLMVFMYEGIVQGVFNYDYAPAAEMVDGRRVYLNLTQEGRDDLDDLRQSGLLFGLKMSSVTYVSTVSFRPTPDGLRFLANRLREEDREAVHKLIYAPGEAVLQSSLLRVAWDARQRAFVMYSVKGYRERSSVTDVESVSYVSSPYIPQVVRLWGRDMRNNRDEVPLLELAKTNIKDELDEVLLLDNPRILFGEWIPMGANQIFALNDRLGSSERVQGGLFTAQVDLHPLSSNFVSPSEGLTEVLVLDYDDSKYVNFEAEVHFPEEDGIVQIENFGIHINEEGFLGYGMVVEGIMDRVEKNMSLDHLARLMVDIYVDSSKVLDNLLSPHQRLMLNTTYANNAEMRIKYSCIVADRIHPLLPAAEYLDKEAKENELKQVIGDTYAAHDLSDTERVIIGRNGLLLVTDDLPKFEPVLMCHLSLMARNVFMTSLFQRSYILMDRLKHIRSLIYGHESNPNSVTIIRNMLSQSSADITLLNEIQLYLSESLQDFTLPNESDDPAVVKLSELLHPAATLTRLNRRIRDMLKTIRGADGEADGLRNMVDAVSDSQNQRVQEAVQDNTKNLEDVYRANARASTSLEIMQVVLAGSLAFDLVDRVHGLYLGDATELDWSVNMFAPIYDTPGVLLIINLCCWLCLGLFIKFLLNHFAAQAAGWMAIRYTINLRYNKEAMQELLRRKNPDVEGGDSDKATVYHKYSWTERNTAENRARWLGEPPRIEVMLDTKHCFLLKSFIQVATRRSKITQKDVREIFFGELREAGVINGYVAGIEEEQEEEFDPTQDSGTQRYNSGDGSAASHIAGTSAHTSATSMKPSFFGDSNNGGPGRMFFSRMSTLMGSRKLGSVVPLQDGEEEAEKEERTSTENWISRIWRWSSPRRRPPPKSASVAALLPKSLSMVTPTTAAERRLRSATAGGEMASDEIGSTVTRPVAQPVLGVLKGGKSFRGRDEVGEVAEGSGVSEEGGAGTLKRAVTFHEKQVTGRRTEDFGKTLRARAEGGHRSGGASSGAAGPLFL